MAIALWSWNPAGWHARNIVSLSWNVNRRAWFYPNSPSLALTHHAGGHRAMVDIVIGRHSMASQNRNSQLDEPRAIGLHLVRNGADDRARWTLHLLDNFGDAVLANNGDVLLPLALHGDLQRAQGARVRRSGKQDAVGARMPLEEVAEHASARLSQPAPVEPDIRLGGDLRQERAHSQECAINAALHKRSGFGHIQPDHPVHLRLPLRN